MSQTEMHVKITLWNECIHRKLTFILSLLQLYDLLFCMICHVAFDIQDFLKHFACLFNLQHISSKNQFWLHRKSGHADHPFMAIVHLTPTQYDCNTFFTNFNFFPAKKFQWINKNRFGPVLLISAHYSKSQFFVQIIFFVVFG